MRLADEMAADAVVELREPWLFGAQRVRKYHALIGRFGRYPGRNAALGRPSTAAELDYLAEETRLTRRDLERRELAPVAGLAPPPSKCLSKSAAE